VFFGDDAEELQNTLHAMKAKLYSQLNRFFLG